MDNRLELQNKLKTLAGGNAYFQPPSSVNLIYPCVIYNLSAGHSMRADDKMYTYTDRFNLLFIFKYPNMKIIEQVLQEFPMCSVSRVYVVDNLYHYAFDLYY